MKRLLLVILALSSLSTFADEMNYPQLISIATRVTANLSGFPEEDVRPQVAESIYNSLGRISAEGEVVLEDISSRSSYFLAQHSSSVCVELYGHWTTCQGEIRLALRDVIGR